MNDRASCRYLTHKYAAFSGCTLEEVSYIVLAYLLIDITLSAVLAFIWGNFFIFLVMVFLASILLIRTTCKLIGKFKEGKQPGYLVLRFKYLLHEKFGLAIPFVTRKGKWSIRRRWL